MYRTICLLCKGVKTNNGKIFFSGNASSYLKRETSKIRGFVSFTGRNFSLGGDRKFERVSERGNMGGV